MPCAAMEAHGRAGSPPHRRRFRRTLRGNCSYDQLLPHRPHPAHARRHPPIGRLDQRPPGARVPRPDEANLNRAKERACQSRGVMARTGTRSARGCTRSINGLLPGRGRRRRRIRSVASSAPQELMRSVNTSNDVQPSTIPRPGAAGQGQHARHLPGPAHISSNASGSRGSSQHAAIWSSRTRYRPTVDQRHSTPSITAVPSVSIARWSPAPTSSSPG